VFDHNTCLQSEIYSCYMLNSTFNNVCLVPLLEESKLILWVSNWFWKSQNWFYECRNEETHNWFNNACLIQWHVWLLSTIINSASINVSNLKLETKAFDSIIDFWHSNLSFKSLLHEYKSF
jgi:hypothetical protein